VTRIGGLGTLAVITTNGTWIRVTLKNY
jgi:hypothetical protein